MNDKRSDLVLLYDKNLSEHLIEQLYQLKRPRKEGGFGWKKVVPWESFVGAECDSVIYVGTGSLEAFSRAKLKLMIITIAPRQGRGYSMDSFTFDACLRKSVGKKLLQKQVLEEKQTVVDEVITVTLTSGSEMKTSSDPQQSRLDSNEMLSDIHWR